MARNFRTKEVENSIQQGLIMLDSQWRCKYVSREFAAMLNRAADGLTGKIIWEMWPDLVGTVAEASLRKTMENHEVQSLEIRTTNADKCFNTSIHPTDDGLCVFCQDVTRHNLIKKTLIDTEEKYSMLINSIDQGFFVIDVIFDENNQPVDLYYVEANETSKTILGTDYTGKYLKEIDPNYESYWYEIFAGVALTGKSVRLEQYAEPDQKWYSFNIFRIGDANSSRIGNIFLDITEKKKAELELIQAKEELAQKVTDKYLNLFNSIDEGFCIIEMIFNSVGKPIDYRFIEVNPAFEKQTGLQNASGRLMRDLVPKHEDHWFEIYGNVALTGEAIRFVDEAKGLNCWYSVYAFKLNTESGNHVAILFKDVTSELLRNEELKRSLMVQDEVFANISHELKTPVNVIFSSNQLMESYLEKDSFEDKKDRIIKNIATTKQNCYRITKLINNIIDLSKIDSGYYKFNQSNQNIVEVIENIVQSTVEYAQGKNLNIIFDTETEEKIIACDPEKIERIILNLISNAIKFSNPESEIKINVADKGEFVEISVTDTGVGIDKGNLNSIFERYRQVDKTLARNAEGSGIGLSLVKAIVDLHGGEMKVESEIGKGSTFTVALPVRVAGQADFHETTRAMNSKVEMINIEFSDIYC